MAYKFKKWRIRWNKGKKKFRKIRRDRTKSRKAHLRFKRNKGKMRKALRVTRRKGRLQMKKNKAAGIYRKVTAARKRWKNLLKSDNDLSSVLDLILNEELSEAELEIISDKDIPGIIEILIDIKAHIESEDEEERKELEDFIDEAIEVISSYEDAKELDPEEEEFLNDIISFIEEYGEEAGYIEDDDEDEFLKKE